MQIQALTRPSYLPYSHQPITPAPQRLSAPLTYSQDHLHLQTQTDNELPPRGSLWGRADVRLGLTMAAGATVGGGIGALVSRSAGLSLGRSVAMGAGIGAILPFAALYLGMLLWDGN